MLGHTLVMGKTQSGKTYFIRERLIPERFTKYDAIIVFNSQGQTWGGYKAKSIFQVMELISEYLGEPLVIDYEPVIRSRDDEIRLFDQLCEVALEIGRILVINDEVQTITTEHFISPNFYGLVRQGNKYGSHYIVASQRPVRFDRSLITQSEEFYFFNLEEVEWMNIKSWLPIEIWNDRSKLEKIRYSYFSKKDGEIRFEKPIGT